MQNFLYTIISAFTTCLILKFLIPLLRNFKFLDIPNYRSAHIKTKVNGGGVAFIFTTLIGSFSQGTIELLILLPLAIIGFFDDKFKIKSIFRFIIQLTTVLVILHISKISGYLLIDNFSIINTLVFGFLIFFGVGLINCINFMDGIDGLVGITLTPAIFLIATNFYTNAFVLLGGIIGFLFWNWSPSKVFMGDTGSLFLGSYLCYSIYTAPEFEIGISICLLLSPLILDSGFTLFRRIINKENIFIAHKSHLYQRLEQNGLSHSKVSIIYFLSALFLLLIYNLTGLYGLIIGSIIVFLIGIYLNQNFTLEKFRSQ